MAKRGNDQDSGSDKAKVRVLFVEVEGNNDSVREALKSMVTAMERPVKMIPVQRAPGNGNGQATLGAQSEAETTVEELVEAEDEEATESQSAAAPRKRGQGPKKDWNEGIKIVPDLNFRTDGKQSLREFDAEKAPKTDQEHVVVLVYYMRNVMDVSQVGPGHILTAFKDIGEPLPSDLRGTIKKCKSKAWLKYSNVNDIQLATGGENLVVHDLPHTSK